MLLGGETCVVTGASGGLGLEAAGGLMAAGAHVVLACRSAPRCQQAKQTLDGRGLPGTCECMELDLCDFSSVRRFAHEMAKKHSKQGVKVLVNNAGVMGLPPAADPLEDGHLVPNHLGQFLLTKEMLGLMSPNSRIVNVASRAHQQGHLEIKIDPQRGVPTINGKPSHWYFSYARSKLCNVLHAAELQRQMDEDKRSITTYSVSPGMVNSGIFRNVWAPIRWALTPLISTVYQTPAQGARTILMAAAAPELEGKHELYLHGMRPCVPSAIAQDPELAKQLWAASEHLIREKDRLEAQNQPVADPEPT